MLPVRRGAKPTEGAGSMRRWTVCFGLVLAAVVAGPGPRAAAQPGLEKLLKIPDTGSYSTDVRGGASRAEWRQRFHDARTAVDAAEKALAASQAKLATVAGEKSEWQFSPPGMPSQPSEDSSSNFQLREQVRRQRGEVDRARARLRELDVQANLAGVPVDWRDESTDSHSGDAAKHGSGTAAAQAH
jgi:hypothetical protein